MNNEDFLNKCKKIASSIQVDDVKNLETIKAKLLLEDKGEEIIMIKNKKIRKPVAVAAILAAILSLSAIVYAAVPLIWRSVDTQVLEGEQYISELGAKISEDGSQSLVYGYFAEDAGRVVVDVEGLRVIFNDDVQPDDFAEAVYVLQLSTTPMLPTYTPEGFSIGSLSYPSPDVDDVYGVLASSHISIAYFDHQDSEVIVLMIYELYEGFQEARDIDGVLTFVDIDNGIAYVLSASPGVEHSTLVRMMQSLR